MVINDLDCDVEDLTLDDFPFEPVETANYIIGQVELNGEAAKLFFCYCSPSILHLSADPETRYEAQQDVQTTLRAWHDTLPKKSLRERSHNSKCSCSYTSFLTINLQQRLQGQSSKTDLRPEDSDIILDSANSITRLVEDAMIYWSPEYFPMMWCVVRSFHLRYLSLIVLG
jgi:hypothetical protein